MTTRRRREEKFPLVAKGNSFLQVPMAISRLGSSEHGFTSRRVNGRLDQVTAVALGGHSREPARTQTACNPPRPPLGPGGIGDTAVTNLNHDRGNAPIVTVDGNSIITKAVCLIRLVSLDEEAGALETREDSIAEIGGSVEQHTRVPRARDSEEHRREAVNAHQSCRPVGVEPVIEMSSNALMERCEDSVHTPCH